MELHAEITASFIDLDEARFRALIRQANKGNTAFREILACIQQGMQIVGEKYSAGEYSVSEMVMASELFRQGIEITLPKMTRPIGKQSGKVIIATVKGDIHDLGKNLVAAMLRRAGFNVVDLGVDVPPERLVETIQDSKARVLCLSGSLNASIEGMKKALNTLEMANIRKEVKVLIGGAQVDTAIQRYTRADAWGKNYAEAIAFCSLHAKN
jgi:methylmalonyl-CoA mutase cobalamin-binding domain/chain